MQAHPKPATPDDDEAYYRAILHDLIDQGADLARTLHQRATADDQPQAADPSIAFDRIARAIRRTIALARHIASNPPRQTPEHRKQARTRVIRAVEDAIEVKARIAPIDTESLHAELAERLQDPALEFDLDSRPLDDIIDEIARDLGVASQARAYVWKRRTPADVAALRTRAAPQPLTNPAPHPRL